MNNILIQVQTLFRLLIFIYSIQTYNCQTYLKSNKPSLAQLTGNTGVRLVHDGEKCIDKGSIIGGWLEVNINGEWGSVCSYYWNRRAADVICKELGYQRAYRFSIICKKPEIRTNQVFSQVRCQGNEESIHNCSVDTTLISSCDAYQDNVALSCVTHYSSASSDANLHLEKPLNIDSALLTSFTGNSISQCSGVVLADFTTQYGYISTIGFDKPDGNVICHQLGLGEYLGKFPDEMMSLYINQSELTLPIVMVKPMCQGLESNLGHCRHWGWGSFDHLKQNGIVSVMCNCQAPALQCDIPLSNIFRLSGSPYPWEGRLEVFRNGEWGRVCPVGFSLNNAHVVCKQLGYFRAKWANKKPFGDGYGPVWYRDLECNGDEISFDYCKYYQPFRDYSRYRDCIFLYGYSDTFISCEVEKPKPKVREAAQKPYVDRCKFIEFEHEGNWYPHCCDGNLPAYYDVNSICRDLVDDSFPFKVGCGYRFDVKVNETLHTLRGNISCKQGTCFGSDCKDENWQVSDTCPDKKYTYVCCKKYLPDVVIDKQELINSLGGISRRRSISRVRTSSLSCAIQDQCLNKDADASNRRQLRYLLRFTTKTFNNGRNTFFPPTSPGLWKWHNCHQHYHSIEAYVSYRLLNKNGSIAAIGHKASFCLEDSGCKQNKYPIHRCLRNGRGLQGISVGCYDTYRSGLDCQWIDISHIRFGSYTLELILNPLRLVAESDFTNNGITCDIEIYSKQNYRYYYLYSCSYLNSDTYFSNSDEEIGIY